MYIFWIKMKKKFSDNVYGVTKENIFCLGDNFIKSSHMII